MLVDIEMKGDCGHRFWWAVSEQLESEDRQEGPPVLCRRCRQQAVDGSLDAPLSGPNRPAGGLQPLQHPALQTYQPPLPVPSHFLDRENLLADVRELLMSVSAPVVLRDQTWAEWFKGIDPVANQIAWKMYAARTASELMQQRTELLKHLEQMFAVATDAALARLDAQIQFLKKENEILELREKLYQRQALAAGRLEHLQLEQRIQRQQLLEATKPQLQPAPADPLRQAAAEHRHRIHVEAQIKQDVLSDYFMAVEDVCGLSMSLHKKALRIRAVMDAFEMDEESLPDNARRIVRAAERLRDED